MQHEKIALVTGASRGIGKACAENLSREGFRVAIHYRSDSDLAAEIAHKLPGSMIFQADLSDSSQCQSLIKDVSKNMGPIHTLVNNAGVTKDQMLTFAKIEDFDHLIEVNLKSVFLLSKFASKMMIKAKNGAIVNITSVVGHTGNSGQSIYAATKSAITGFTKSIATDLARFNIRCNCVAPGFIATEMTSQFEEEQKNDLLKAIPMQRMGEASEVAQAVAFLASERATYITGATLHVNGGMYKN